MMSDHEVQMVKDNMSEFNVKFHGPKDSAISPASPAQSHRPPPPAPAAACDPFLSCYALAPAPWRVGCALRF